MCSSISVSSVVLIYTMLAGAVALMIILSKRKGKGVQVFPLIADIMLLGSVSFSIFDFDSSDIVAAVLTAAAAVEALVLLPLAVINFIKSYRNETRKLIKVFSMMMFIIFAFFIVSFLLTMPFMLINANSR